MAAKKSKGGGAATKSKGKGTSPRAAAKAKVNEMAGAAPETEEEEPAGDADADVDAEQMTHSEPPPLAGVQTQADEDAAERADLEARGIIDPTAETARAFDEAGKVAALSTRLRDIGFERTGAIVDDVAVGDLEKAVAILSDGTAEAGARTVAEGVVARDGWFSTPLRDAIRAQIAGAPNPTPKGPSEMTLQDIAKFRADAEQAKAGIDAAEAEAKALVQKARDAYRDALELYRNECKAAGVPCEIEGHKVRAANVSEKVTFKVAREGDEFVIEVEGRPETLERIPVATISAGVSKAAYAYTDKHIGPKDVVGNKGGTLQNKLRALLQVSEGGRA